MYRIKDCWKYNFSFIENRKIEIYKINSGQKENKLECL